VFAPTLSLGWSLMIVAQFIDGACPRTRPDRASRRRFAAENATSAENLEHNPISPIMLRAVNW